MMTTTFEPRRVACALDLEQPADGLLEIAASIAKRFDASLHLVHVWLPAVAMTPEGGMSSAPGELTGVAVTLTEALDAIAASLRETHPDVKTAVVMGAAWHEIVAYAETNDCDLIVAGTHGRGGLARLIQGSVAERIVRGSPVPVLVVPNHPASAPARVESETDEDDQPTLRRVAAG
jgi:nucleotide-binding universal stress UspA family protein